MIKLGIIGYGKIGGHHHKVFTALGAKVVASCNRSEEGRSVAKKSGIERTYSLPSEMIEEEKLDAIICSTSIFNNYAVAKAIIPYKIPILLEKPPGTSLEELNKLISLQEKYGTVVMIATNRIWYSVLHNAIEDIGGEHEIEGVQVMWSENPKKLKKKRGFSDTQILSRNYSNSIHGLSILQYLTGGLSSFQVLGYEKKGSFDRNMILQGLSQRGVTGQFVSSWSSTLPWRLSFYGRNKIYDFVPLEKCICTNLETREQKEITAASFDEKFKTGFYLQAKHFLAVIQGGKMSSDVTLQNAQSLFNYAKALTDIT